MITKEHSYIAPRNMRALNIDTVDGFEDLSRIGINITKNDAIKMMNGLDAMGEGMDNALQPLLNPASIPAYSQFLQSWLPGFVNVVTQVRKIDELVGIQTAGSWEDEEVIQGTMELTGQSMPYGDYTNIPLSSWNLGYDRRTIIRFEEGLRVGKLEEARSAKMGVNSGQQKRDAAAIALDIQRNKVGFFGYNAGANRTYGFLNDPNLPAYNTVPVGASGQTTWASKTFLEIIADIRTALSTLRNNSGDLIDPMKTQITIAIASDCVDYFTVISQFGYSIYDFLGKNYPQLRIVSAPELNYANGGLNVFYVYAESVSDSSTDGGRTFVQVVPAKFQVVGVQQQAKAYVEDYTNALGGVICKRPWAVARYTGI